jgi:hypothetical protein
MVTQLSDKEIKMTIDANTKRFTDKAIKGTFPQRGQYFYATRCDGIRDYSYMDDVFQCDGSDPIKVVARCLTDLRTEPFMFMFNRNRYTFSPVSEEVLNAVGIHPSPEDTWRVSIVVDPNWMVPGFECVRIGQPQHGEQFLFNGNIYREGFLPEIDLLTHEPMGRHPALPLIIVKEIVKNENNEKN